MAQMTIPMGRLDRIAMGISGLCVVHCVATAVLLGLLAWPHRLAYSLFGAIAIALVLMLVARPVAVLLCLWPFKFHWNEKIFISWVGLRGAVGIFLASIPMLVGLPGA